MIEAITAAKINLYLDIIRRREDGYHEIETFYQPVSLWDRLVFEETRAGIAVTGNDPSIPWNEENLVHRAARLMFEATSRPGGVRIEVTKGIPPGAGLGGGSSDAAATLLALNRLFACGLSDERLLEIAGMLGSDVPLFILGKPAIGRGRGEILEEAPGLPGGWILIAKPNITISTRWAYQNLNLVLTNTGGKNRLGALLSGLQRFPDVRLETHNSFESGVVERFPGVAGILATLREAKPILSTLSGSGSACFAVFGKESEAREVAKRIESEGVFTRVVQPITNAIILA